MSNEGTLKETSEDQGWPHEMWPDDQFKAMYCQVTEQTWRAMSRRQLSRWNQAVVARGLGAGLCHDLQLHTLPSFRVEQAKELSAATTEAQEMSDPSAAELLVQTKREAWAEAREVLDSGPARSVMASLVAIEKGAESLPSAMGSTSPSLPVTGGSPSSKGSMVSGGTLTGSEIVPDVGPVNATDPQSFGMNSGVPMPAASGLQTEVYLRLPLSAKRDAFVSDGFLFVRDSVLKSWMRHFTAGSCCTQQRSGLSGHSSSCWIYSADVR